MTATVKSPSPLLELCHSGKNVAETVPQGDLSTEGDACRVAALQQVLNKGYDVIVSDVDTVWLKNPFASLALGESNFQLTVDSDVGEDGSQKPCTGVMRVTASEPSRHAPPSALPV